MFNGVKGAVAIGGDKGFKSFAGRVQASLKLLSGPAKDPVVSIPDKIVKVATQTGALAGAGNIHHMCCLLIHILQLVEQF